MCVVCAACHNPFRAAAAGALAYTLIDTRMLCWLTMFIASMSLMDHRRDANASTEKAD